MSARPDFDGEPIWRLARYRKQAIARERCYRGTVSLDIREWQGDNGDSATGKGISIPREAVKGLALALLAYADSLDAEAEGNCT